MTFPPRDYPRSLVVDEIPLCNEQYLLEAFLAFNRAFRVVGAINYLWHHHISKLVAECPVLALEPWRELGSFWMVRA